MSQGYVPSIRAELDDARTVARWYANTHSNHLDHDYHCPRLLDHKPDPCTCGWDEAKEALGRLADLAMAREGDNRHGENE